MKALKLSLCFFIIFLLSACSDSQLKNLTSFIDNYNDLADDNLSVTDFFYYDACENTPRAFIGDNECKVILSLKEDENSKIESVKLTLPKGNSTLPKEKLRDIFCRVLTHTLKSYCSYDSEIASEILNSFELQNPETLYKQGELTLKRDNFYFVYYSNEVASEVIVYNTYIHTVEPTEKPVSRPYYGEDFIEKKE